MKAMSLVAGGLIPLLAILRGQSADSTLLELHGLGYVESHVLAKVLPQTANHTYVILISRHSSGHSFTPNVSEVVVGLPFCPRTVSEYVVVLLFGMGLYIVKTDDKFVVGEVVIEVISLIAAAGKEGVHHEDRDSGHHEDGVHEGTDQAVDVEVSLQRHLSSHEFVLLLFIPLLYREEQEAKDSAIDDPLEESRPLEASVTAGLVLTHGDPF